MLTFTTDEIEKACETLLADYKRVEISNTQYVIAEMVLLGLRMELSIMRARDLTTRTEELNDSLSNL